MRPILRILRVIIGILEIERGIVIVIGIGREDGIEMEVVVVVGPILLAGCRVVGWLGRLTREIYVQRLHD